MPVEPASHGLLAADFRLGEWLVRPSLNRLTRSGRTVPVEPRTIDVLAFLARHPGRVLTKEEILEAVWKRQFVSEATLSHAVAELRRALGDNAQRPRFIETIPKRGYRLIAPVGSADADALPASPEPSGPAGAPTPDSPPKLGRLFVARFVNQTGDETLEPLGAMAADWVSQGLSTLGLVEVIPFSSTLAAAAFRGKPAARTADGTLLLAREAGAGTIVSGACYAAGDSLEIQLRVSDATTGRLLVAPDPVEGSRDAPMALVEGLRDRAMSAVAVLLDPALDRAAFSPRRDAARRHHPPRFDAYREYLAGLEAFGADDREAVRRLRRAAELDPGFAAPLLLLEGALLGQGDFAGAQLVLDRLEALRDRLTPLEIEVLEAKRADLEGRTAEALRRFSRALSLSPTDPALRFQVATHELALGRPARIIEAYGEMDLAPLENQPAILWFFGFLTAAQHVLGRFEDELEAAGRASALHTARLPFLQATVRSLAALGRLEELSRALVSSRSLPEEGLTPGHLAALASDELRAHGQEGTAALTSEEALDWLRSRRGGRNEEGRLLDEGRLLAGAGRFREAQQALALLAERAPGNVEVLALLGTAAARAGDVDTARRCEDDLVRAHGPRQRGRATYARARIAASLGERNAALTLLAEAFSEGYPWGVGLHADPGLEPLRGLPAFQEILRPKVCGRDELPARRP